VIPTLPAVHVVVGQVPTATIDNVGVNGDTSTLTFGVSTLAVTVTGCTPPEDATMVTVAEADFEVSAWLVAVIVTVLGEGTTAGAVYRPEVVIVPTVEFPPTTLFTDQVTAVFDVPVTVAVNCCVAETGTETDGGLMVMETVTGGVVDPPPPPPHAMPNSARPSVKPSNARILKLFLFIKGLV
jgi:hypothetical protein